MELDKKSLAAENKKILTNSKALYTVVIYCFIALFILIILPFLPITKTGSLFESGLNKFQESASKNQESNMFATVSMIPHSLLMLGMGILMLSKFKKHKAAVAYSFYKYFMITVAVLFGVYFGFYITGNVKHFITSYGIEYWLYVLIGYAPALIFMLVAQFINAPTRPSIGKFFYNFLGLGATVGMYFYAQGSLAKVLATNNYNTVAFSEIYKWIMHLLELFMGIKIALFVVPVNDCFNFMYNREKCKRGKKTLIRVWVNATMFFVALAVFILFLIAGGYAEIGFMLTFMAYFGLQIIGARIFNITFKPEVVEEETTETFSFFKDQTENTAKPQGGTTFSEKGALWDVDKLRAQGESLVTKEKHSLGEICADIHKAMASKGLTADITEVREILAAVTASKLVFIKCNETKLLNKFSEILSDYFGGELFFEKKGEEKSYIPEPPKVEEKKEEPKVEESKPFSMFSALSTEEETISEQPAADEQADILAEQKAQEEKAALEKAQEEKKNSEQKIKNKYGIASGIFVAYHLGNAVSLVFLDCTSLKELSSTDADIVSALSHQDREIYVGKLDYLPKCENYNKATLTVPENVRMVVFVNGTDTEISAHHEWVKYATVLKLNLSEEYAQVGEELPKHTVLNDMLGQTVEEAQEECFLTEEYWRKIDKLEEYLAQTSNIHFDNKFIRQIEKYIASFIACGAERTTALDAVLANRIIPYISIEKEAVITEQQSDFSLHLDEIFGLENIPLTKSAIAEYGLKR